MTPSDTPAKPSRPAVPATPRPKAKADKPAHRKFNLNSKNLRQLLLLGLGISIFFFFAATFMGISLLSSKSKALVDLKVQNQTATNELLNLEQSKKEIEQYSYFKTVAKTVIPNDKDQAEAVLETFQMAEASGIAIQGVTFPASTLGAPAISPSSTSTTPTDATSSSSTASALTQAKPVANIPGLYSLELTINPETGPNVPANKIITYPKILNFLSRIENNRHTAQITQINIIPATSTQGLTFSLIINIFIKP
jgi:hypothetical protein